jgi:asparagine synthase (glutamine-hydrolysing)
MCGIAGIINTDREAAGKSLGRMVTAMVHRGPDACGTAMETLDRWTVGLGHTRLSIIDLSTLGSQPMKDAANQCAICYNGEIYNFIDLRDELIAEGVRFKSRCDTEVVLEGYKRWGLDVFPKLRGMFALAIWDPLKHKLVLARDSLAIKPLYYYCAGKTVLFASEVRALLASGLVPRRLDRDGLASYLSFGSVSAPRTILDGVQSLMPGECCEIALGESLLLCRSRFEFPPARTRRRPATRAEAVDTLRSILTDSVTCHLVSDVPVGLFLSGGIDSSAIACILGRELKIPLRSFNIAFAEREFAEQQYATSVAQACGTDHSQVLLSESDMLAGLPRALSSMDQPTMDGINTWVVSKAVNEAGIRVALSGLGGDELFCGYSSFRRARLLRRISRVPRPMRAAVAAVGRTFVDGTVRTAKFWDMLDSRADAQTAYAVSRRVFTPGEIHALAGLEPPPPIWPEPDSDVINSVSRLESQGYMANTLLRDSDFMAMAHSLEIRVPFVDREVVQYVMRLPGNWKVDRNRPKPLLLDAVGDLLPREIWRRPKMGFGIPFRKWMTTTLRPDIDAVLSGADGSDVPICRDTAASVWRNFQASPESERWSRSWSLYVLHKWCASNRVTA